VDWCEGICNIFGIRRSISSVVKAIKEVIKKVKRLKVIDDLREDISRYK